MADYSIYKPGVGKLGTHGWYLQFESHIDATELVANEVETARQGQTNLNAKITAMDSATTAVTSEVTTARQGQANLSASIDLRVPKSGLTANFSAQNYRFTTLANPVNPQDAVNLQTVQSLISGGGTPSNIAVTSLNKGTATTLQLYRVNAGGTAIEGVTPSTLAPNFAITDTNQGNAKNGHVIGVQNGAVVGRNLTYDLMFFGRM
jgi:hypothetical protein